MDHDLPEDSPIEEVCWAVLDLAASIRDPVERLVVLQEATDEVASAQRRLESAKVAALSEALLHLSIERLMLQMDACDDIVTLVEPGRPANQDPVDPREFGHEAG